MLTVRIGRLVDRFAVFVAILVLAIWALTSALGSGSSGATFWPIWVWFGLAVPLAFGHAGRWAWRRPAGRERRASLIWALGGVVAATLVVIWLIESITAGASPYFWPAWPLLALLALAGGYAIVVLHEQVDPGSRRKALAARVDSLTRSGRRAADAQAAELGRIERDLHDGAQARLVALSMQLGRAELALEKQPRAKQLVADARQEAARAIADLRDLSRGIAPPLLADRGLVAAVRALATRYDADVFVDHELESRRVAPAVERGAYFVVAEALTNAAKHASARRTTVRLALDDGTLSVIVADDGQGGADPLGSGLSGLRGRVEALGGTLQLASPSGQGTSVEARFPTGS
jgi:signal transduction histidine kinase